VRLHTGNRLVARGLERSAADADNGGVSYAAAISRVASLQAMIQGVAGPGAAPGGASFATALAAAPAAAMAPTNPYPAVTDPAAAGAGPAGIAGLFPTTGGTAGQRALAAAQAEVGVREQPPGSNEGPRIATYRTATAGAYGGAPWCAYFVSWCAKQAGSPIGDHGEGLGSVAGVTDWARRTGRLTQTPQPGDLILFGTRHIGIVESLNPDGSVNTIEGNSSHQVARRHHAASAATGYVRL
jgi:hypothetical protein